MGRDAPRAEDLGFYLTGFGMAGVGVLLAVVIAVLTLLVGAADQLLDARRPLASLAALGVDGTSRASAAQAAVRGPPYVRAATRLLRSRLTAVLDPENLRVA